MASVTVHAAGERSLARRHPWIFSRALAAVNGAPEIGGTVAVSGSSGRSYGLGAYSPSSQIAVRMWSFSPDDEISAGFFRRRLERAAASRAHLKTSGDVTAYRLVNAESDGLPGLIVDHYGSYLVCQLLSAGAEMWRDTVVSELSRLIPCDGILERSDTDARHKEGLEPRVGTLAGREAPELVEVRENGCRFLVDLNTGHKTGFYLDQRTARSRLATHAAGAEVLNCFAYTGAFAVAALANGAAEVLNVESSSAALQLAERNIELNGLDPSTCQQVEGNVFQVLRQLRDQGRRFDIVVLDPPKFADSRRHLERASRGYKDINLLGLKLLRPGGLLFTFSCSGVLAPELFQKIVADAAVDADRDAQIIERLAQPEDHPVALPFPEGQYLKGLVCRVTR